MTKWTKGPWVKDYSGTVGHIKSICKDLDCTPTVARWDVITPSLSDEEREANGHLITAAPDGYAFAVTVESMIVDGGLSDDPAWRPVLSECRAFMAKALGEDYNGS